MKKLTIIVALIMAPVLASAQNPFDSFEDENDVSSVVVTKNMFKLLSKMDLDSEDPEAKEYLDMVDNLDNIKVFTTENQAVAKKMSSYSGLTETSILQNNLDVSTSFFWKDLLRNKTGQTIGRLDSRYLGLDKTEAGDSPDFNPELTSWLHSFTPAINYYIREHLNFKTDIKYNMFGDVRPWDNKNNNVRDNLRKAMAENREIFVEATLTVEASGRPRIAHS